MTNQNNEFGKSPVKLSSPTQIWIDDVKLEAYQNATLMRADLYWCIGKLRGLGYPAENLEKTYGIEP